MTFPMWLGALGAGLGGINNAYKDKRARDQRQQMIAALQQARGQNNTGFGQTPASFGPQSWGAGSASGGSVVDPWGHPIGPAAQGGGQPGAGGGAGPLANAPPPQPDIWSSGGGSVPYSGMGMPDPSVANLPSQPPPPPPPGPSASPSAGPVPFTGGPAQAQQAASQYGGGFDPQMGSYGASDPMLSGLFGGAIGF